ncbi:MAG: peptide deformylase [Flavobacteriaceae bacterium]|nr:peptide deformylase [Flavobacteriaceae bacterium]
MILPIIAYGDKVLRKKCINIDANYPKLEKLIADMKETMHNALGVGLAAPQINKAIRLFIVDTTPFANDEDLSKEEKKKLKNFNDVFINAKITHETGDQWAFNEGCLSIPNIREDVFRKDTITIEYLDENLKPKKKTLNGLIARVVQHEYDHIEGILFTDKLSTLKKKLIKKKLEKIARGKVDVDYRMKFPLKK